MDIDNNLRLGIKTNLIKEIRKQIGNRFVSFICNNPTIYETYVFENESKYTEYIINLVDIILDDVVAKHEQSNKFAEDVIGDTAKEIRQKLQDSSNGKFKIYNKEVSLPFVMFAKLQNGKIIERTFGTKDNGQQYTPEEIKVILKEAEEVELGKKFKDGRLDKFTFLSMIVDMIDKSIGENSKNPIRFITPDNDNKDEVYKEIQQTVNKAKQDPNSPNILLIPYSADEHIVTLLVDKREFPNRNSIACFDSSHYFNKFGSLNPKYFSKDLLYTLDAHQKPINKSIIQKLSSTCSFSIQKHFVI